MSATLKLYEYTDALDVVKAWVLEHDDEIRAAEGAIPDELAELLSSAELGFSEKAENVALFIRELLANAEAVKAEKNRLDARVRHYERAAESLKGYLKEQMQRADIPKVEGKLVTVRVQKNPPSVKVLLDQETLSAMRDKPETMLFVQTVPESYRVDTDYVKALYKNGTQLPQGITVEQGCHVRIV